MHVCEGHYIKEGMNSKGKGTQDVYGKRVFQKLGQRFPEMSSFCLRVYVYSKKHGEQLYVRVIIQPVLHIHPRLTVTLPHRNGNEIWKTRTYAMRVGGSEQHVTKGD